MSQNENLPLPLTASAVAVIKGRIAAVINKVLRLDAELDNLADERRQLHLERLDLGAALLQLQTGLTRLSPDDEHYLRDEHAVRTARAAEAKAARLAQQQALTTPTPEPTT